MTEKPWAPNPDWPPHVQRFVTGLHLYLVTLPPDERDRVMQDIALRVMDPSYEGGES